MTNPSSPVTMPPEASSTRPIRVLFLSYTFQPEPGVVRGLPLAKWLAARGYEVKVLTGFPQYPIGKIYPGYKMSMFQWENMEGVPVLRVPLYPSHDTSAAKRILTYLSFAVTASTLGAMKIGPVDIVYYFDNTPTTGWVAGVIKRLRGASIVKHIADIWPESVTESGMIRGERLNRIVYGLIFRWFQRLYRQSSAVTVLSPGFKKILLERGQPDEKVQVIYNWAEEDLFHPLPPDPPLKKELGMEGRFNFVYAGNIGQLQNMVTVVHAAARVRHVPEIQVVIIGTGPHLDTVKQAAQEAGATNVRFVDRRPLEDMPRINSISDVLLVHLKDVAFLRSTIPSKVQVSLASGRPILMGVAGDAAALIEESGGGRVVPPDNEVAMAQAMEEMARMPRPQLEAMGRKGREYYLQNLSLDIAGKQMDALFRQIVEERTRKGKGRKR